MASFALSASRRIHVDPVDPAVRAAGCAPFVVAPPTRRAISSRADGSPQAGGFLLTASIIVLFVVAIIVGVVLDMIDNQSGLATADESVAAWGSQHGSTARPTRLKWITQLGSTPVVFRRAAARGNASISSGDAVAKSSPSSPRWALGEFAAQQRPQADRPPRAAGGPAPCAVPTATRSPPVTPCCRSAGWLAIALVLGRDRPKIDPRGARAVGPR